MDEVVTIIEEVRGGKMNVEYRTFEQVRKEKEECKDEMMLFWIDLEAMCATNEEDKGIIRPVLNELCPHVKPISVEAYVRKFWSE